jgi:hypothetical protein
MRAGHAVATLPSLAALPDRPFGGRMDVALTASPTEDDVTDPGAANDADRAEQEALLDPAPVTVAGDVAAPGDGVPEADALEQQLAARPGEAGSPDRPVGDREANEADVLEQSMDVPADEDDLRG